MPARGALLVDLTGRTFGCLTVLGFADRVRRSSRWLCQCSCGGSKVVRGSLLLNGDCASCGCIKREMMAALGRSGAKHYHRAGNSSSTYRSWQAMLARVRGTSNARDRRNYFERGIAVAERWLSFENFLTDMGERPDGHSIDRVNNDGNYEPGNCRWATPLEQASNRRRGLKVGRPKGSKNKGPMKPRRKLAPTEAA